MKDRIPRWLQYCHKVCCEKDGYHGRHALIVGKEYTVEMCFLDEWTCHITQYYKLHSACISTTSRPIFIN